MGDCRRILNSFLVGMVLASLISAGCRNCDLVEAELRTRERELRELQAHVEHLEADNQALRRELGDIHRGSARLSPELASQTYTLRQITLGRVTGGVDNDRRAGKEALRVVLETRDGDGHVTKAPGAVHIDVLEISPEGLKRPLCAWDLKPAQVRSTWKAGLFCTGYDLVLPWKAWPTSPRLRVIVRFALADGRLFEVDKDIDIRLPAGVSGPRLPNPDLVPLHDDPLLPLPRKLTPDPQADTPNLSTPAGGNAAGLGPANYWQPSAAGAGPSPVRVRTPVVIPDGPTGRFPGCGHAANPFRGRLPQVAGFPAALSTTGRYA